MGAQPGQAGREAELEAELDDALEPVGGRVEARVEAGRVPPERLCGDRREQTGEQTSEQQGLRAFLVGCRTLRREVETEEACARGGACYLA